MASHLDKGFYTYDKRVLSAYEEDKHQFLYSPAHRDEAVLSKYGKPVYDKFFPNDQGIALIYWTAFKIFGDYAPVKAIWKLQAIVDIMSIVCIFFICRMLFGNAEGLLAAFFYSINAFLDIVKTSPLFAIRTTFYYYWMGPFALITTLFFVWLIKTEAGGDMGRLKRYAAFAGYGIIAGFFSLVRSNLRLILIFPGLFYLLLNKKDRKHKTIALLVAMVIQFAPLLPISMYNAKVLGTRSVTTRYVWHQIIVGIGFYDNPYNLKFDDSAPMKIANRKYGMKMTADDIMFPEMKRFKKYEAAMKKEVMQMLWENPGMFLTNTVKNLYYGFLLAPKDDTMKVFNLNKLPTTSLSITYLVLLCTALGYFFIFSKEMFYGVTLIIVISLYFLLSVCAFNPPFDYYIYAYYPLFYILFAVGIINTPRAIKAIVNR